MRIFANSLTANSKPRAYLKALGENTWDLAVWLQHYVDASELDAEIVLGATQALLRAFTLMRVRHGQPTSGRCPSCDSYQVVEESSELKSSVAATLGRSCTMNAWHADGSRSPGSTSGHGTV